MAQPNTYQGINSWNRDMFSQNDSYSIFLNDVFGLQPNDSFNGIFKHDLLLQNGSYGVWINMTNRLLNMTNRSLCDQDPDDGHKEFYEYAQYITGLIIYPVLCVLGITGNLLALIVLVSIFFFQSCFFFSM